MPVLPAAFPFGRALKLFAGAILLLLLGTVPAFAHPLNATRLTTSFHPDGRITGKMEIDLVYLLGGSEEYYRISQLAPAEQEEALAPALRKIEEGVFLKFAETRVNLEIGTFELPGQSLEEYRAYRIKSMTELEVSAKVPPGKRTFTLEVDSGLAIEYPVVFQVFFEGEPRQFLSTMVFKDHPSEPFLLPQRLVVASAEEADDSVSLAADKSAEDDEEQGGFSTHLFKLYVKFGFLHIVPEGLDHILFVLGLFFLRIHWKPLLAQVTAFTVAHSITLGLSVYGLISLPMSVVEPLVLLSIIFVAVENVIRTKLSPWRVGIVFAFGLLHGLGFAGFLAELEIPRESFLMALLSFNIGVELGQLAVIGAAFVIVGWWRNHSWYRASIASPASILIASVGLYWMGGYLLTEL